ncbi:MAG TPA: tyrosine-type recombinase/integrase [Candidatus Dormibacteraeota bacterium]|nr:tyrosine-type recombinase/integrase [Candidatus Dormibacteraeota bacterium]
MIRQWEVAGELPAGNGSEPMTIEQAKTEFLADAEARKLKNSTIDRHRILFRQLEQFAKTEGMRYLKELDTQTLRRFRTSWKDGDLAGLKKLERLRTFFRFARENGWVADNPALAIKGPRVTLKPTLPFSQDEMIRILAAATKKIESVHVERRNKARRVRALVLLLRYSGLRISDAVGCSVERLQGGKIWLYTQKTGQHVYCPLPEFVVKELDAVPTVSEHHWFWTGNGTVETSRKKWSEALAALFKAADVKDGHAHRFRDTFAVELLTDGTPIENVQAFLGHASARVTEKHYAPWVRARQERAEADVKRSWERDPLVLMETKGTPEVHGKPEAVN